ncbi:MAG: 30S ribosomal protein S13 [Candidatus Zixiibacteriota bacterium]|nr:MAG: 30S ribosomal protein S13 [candidate division Zixibacteria bacterium]
MARIAGVDLPKDKRIQIGLRYIFGIGPFIADRILDKTGIDPDTRVNQLVDSDVAKLRAVIENDYTVEGALRGEISMNIKRLIDIGSYRGLRHRRGLPVRGQRTKTNARTRKGPRRAVGGLKRKPAGAK